MCGLFNNKHKVVLRNIVCLMSDFLVHCYSVYVGCLNNAKKNFVDEGNNLQMLQGQQSKRGIQIVKSIMNENFGGCSNSFNFWFPILFLALPLSQVVAFNRNGQVYQN